MEQNDKSTREKMKEFWEKNCKQATLQEVMLDSMADELDKAEKPEISGMLPSLANKRVLEFGAGIGRYTSVLAENANSVKSVDFIEKFLHKNQELNATTHPNVTFVCSDVMSMDLGEDEFDLVFSNWLLMYLDDNELEVLAKRLLRALKPGGSFFFRETCSWNSASGVDVHPNSDGNNPSRYRKAQHYHRVYETAEGGERDKADRYGFELCFSRCVHAYLRIKGCPNEMCWLWKKVLLDKGTQRVPGAEASKSTRQYLDAQMYVVDKILSYEFLFGENFISTGGIEFPKENLPKLELKEGENVLDAGSGLGGASFLMAENYGVNVLGVDLSTNMVQITLQRAVQCKRGTVMFEVSDLTKRQFADGAFDAIYCVGVFLHIEDKEAMLKKFFQWLKPNGRVLMTDYCCTIEQHTDASKNFVDFFHYFMHGPEEYRKTLERAGFTSVVVENYNAQLLSFIQCELKKFDSQKAVIADIKDLVSHRSKVVEHVTKGDLSYLVLTARKR